MSDDLSIFDLRTTFGANALDYEFLSRQHLGVASERAIALAGIDRDMAVLDAGCGTGSSTIPSALLVGPRVRVVAVDFAPEMLALATEKASYRALLNIEWRLEDMTALKLAPGSFDAVLCVLGIFNVADMPALAASFWRLLRPGGRLVLASTNGRLLDPIYTLFLDAVCDVCGPFVPAQPWLQPHTADQMVDVLARAGIAAARFVEETVISPPLAPEDCWRIIRGTGLDLMLDVESPERARRARAAVKQALHARGVASVATSVLFAVAVKP